MPLFGSNATDVSGVQRGLIGRKLFSFIVYAVVLTGFAWLMTHVVKTGGDAEVIKTLLSVVIQGMWMITYIGMFVVGGQTFIDSLVPILTRWADAFAARGPAGASTTSTTETVKKVIEVQKPPVDTK